MERMRHEMVLGWDQLKKYGVSLANERTTIERGAQALQVKSSLLIALA